jgi:hypothetical protein
VQRRRRFRRLVGVAVLALGRPGRPNRCSKTKNYCRPNGGRRNEKEPAGRRVVVQAKTKTYFMDNDDYPPFMRNAMRDSVLRAHRRVGV